MSSNLIICYKQLHRDHVSYLRYFFRSRARRTASSMFMHHAWFTRRTVPSMFMHHAWLTRRAFLSKQVLFKCLNAHQTFYGVHPLKTPQNVWHIRLGVISLSAPAQLNSKTVKFTSKIRKLMDHL
jgi:hypothetical protein